MISIQARSRNRLRFPDYLSEAERVSLVATLLDLRLRRQQVCALLWVRSSTFRLPMASGGRCRSIAGMFRGCAPRKHRAPTFSYPASYSRHGPNDDNRNGRSTGIRCDHSSEVPVVSPMSGKSFAVKSLRPESLD